MKFKNPLFTRGCSILLLLIMLHILELGCFGLGYYWLDLQARSRMATRLNVAPDWASLRDYIPEHIKPGMARIEVLQEASRIGAYAVEPFITDVKYCEAFYFYIGPFRSSRGGRWEVCYDEGFIVTSVQEYFYQ